MGNEIVPALVTGSSVTALILVIEHYALWERRNRIKRPVAYVLGTLAIGVGLAVTSGMLDQWIIAVAYFAILLPGGAIIAGLWWNHDDQPTAADEIIGRAQEHLNAIQGARGDRRN